MINRSGERENNVRYITNLELAILMLWGIVVLLITGLLAVGTVEKKGWERVRLMAEYAGWGFVIIPISALLGRGIAYGWVYYVDKTVDDSNIGQFVFLTALVFQTGAVTLYRERLLAKVVGFILMKIFRPDVS